MSINNSIATVLAICLSFSGVAVAQDTIAPPDDSGPAAVATHSTSIAVIDFEKIAIDGLLTIIADTTDDVEVRRHGVEVLGHMDISPDHRGTTISALVKVAQEKENNPKELRVEVMTLIGRLVFDATGGRTQSGGEFEELEPSSSNPGGGNGPELESVGGGDQ